MDTKIQVMKHFIEDNKAIACRFTEAHNQGKIGELSDLLAPNFVSHISDWPHPLNRDEYIQAIEKAKSVFSNLVFTVNDVIGEGEKIVLRITARGKHIGEYQGIAPTGKQVEFSAITIRRIIDGKIVEEWQTNDQFSLFQQLGGFSKAND